MGKRVPPSGFRADARGKAPLIAIREKSQALGGGF